jgi:hypothetical protein
MPLSVLQVKELREAIEGYSFPAVFYDFVENSEVQTKNMAEVENIIGPQLRSGDLKVVKNGLSNVLYWSYARIGYRDRRVRNFREHVTPQQLVRLQTLTTNGKVPTMDEIKEIHLPEYSGMSFLSKILMFLNPLHYCVLDTQITRLRTQNSDKALNSLSFGPNENQIRISKRNENVYDYWRNECPSINATYYAGKYRVVDVERGFFNLLQQDRLSQAQQIYNEA